MSSPVNSAHMMYHPQSASSSPQLVTPSGTPPATTPNFPPTFSEARLAQILSNFDHGTHSFDRAERETQEERRVSFSDAYPPQQVTGRRPSFLSSLSLTRPGFGFSSTPSSGTSTPIQTPTSASHPKDHLLAGLAMTKTTPTSPQDPIARPKSTPANVQWEKKEVGKIPPPMEMQRSNTAPQKVAGGFGGVQGMEKLQTKHYEEKRHFDPSREPRLLSLL